MYLKAKKKDSTDFYATEMKKLFVNNQFLQNDLFENYHKQYLNAALEIFESQRTFGGGKLAFNKYKNELLNYLDMKCYSHYKETNKLNFKNWKESEKSVSQEPYHTIVWSQAKGLYVQKIKKICGLSKSDFKLKDDEIRKECLKSVS